MYNMKKKLMSLALALVMCISLCVSAFAYASEVSDKDQAIELGANDSSVY